MWWRLEVENIVCAADGRKVNGSNTQATSTTIVGGDPADQSNARYLARSTTTWSFWLQGRRRCRMGLDLVLVLEGSNNRRDHIQTGRGEGEKRRRRGLEERKRAGEQSG